jgi:hypothetical protein
VVALVNGTLSEKDYIRNLRSIQVIQVSADKCMSASLGTASLLNVSQNGDVTTPRTQSFSAAVVCEQHTSKTLPDFLAALSDTMRDRCVRHFVWSVCSFCHLCLASCSHLPRVFHLKTLNTWRSCRR